MGFTGRRLIANSNISMRDLLKPGWLSGWERKIFAETFTFSEKISHVMFPELLIHYAGTLLELCFSFGERKGKKYRLTFVKFIISFPPGC